MSILFDFYATPSAKEGGEQMYHPRPVASRTVETDELMKEIETATSMTGSDVLGILEALHSCMVKHLSNGERVHLDGIGYFRVSLTAPPTSQPKSIHAQQVKFKSVNYRADAKLGDKMKSAATERASTAGQGWRAKHSQALTQEEIEAKAVAYFADHTHLTRRSFQDLCGLTRSMAVIWINRLRDSGLIKNTGTRNQPIYVLNEE